VTAHPHRRADPADRELLAVEEAKRRPEVSGRITAMRVSEGAAVTRGDVVLEIDRERRELELANERAMVAAARSEIAQEKREHARIQTLFKSAAASQAQLDARQHAHEHGPGQARCSGGQARPRAARRARRERGGAVRRTRRAPLRVGG
jgi:multidrug resistance efflux pump